MPDTITFNEARFTAKIERRSPSECWPWTGSCYPAGYGQVNVKHADGKWRPTSAHRLAFMQANPDADVTGLSVCHHCDNPPCCNPSHLFLGTAADNNHDMHAKGRNRQPKGSARWWQVKLNEQQIGEIRRRYIDGETTAQLARAFGVAQNTVSVAVRGGLWKHVGGSIPLRWARAKLSHRQIIEVRNSREPIPVLAERYGVERRVIRDIKEWRTFKDIVSVPE